MRSVLFAAWLGAVIVAGPATAANTDEATPKRGGTLTYMIPADPAWTYTARRLSRWCTRSPRSTAC